MNAIVSWKKASLDTTGKFHELSACVIHAGKNATTALAELKYSSREEVVSSIFLRPPLQHALCTISIVTTIQDDGQIIACFQGKKNYQSIFILRTKLESYQRLQFMFYVVLLL